jgi:hypothetical protein
VVLVSVLVATLVGAIALILGRLHSYHLDGANSQGPPQVRSMMREHLTRAISHNTWLPKQKESVSLGAVATTANSTPLSMRAR